MFIDNEVIAAHIQALTQERDRLINHLLFLQLRDYNLAQRMQETVPRRNLAIARAGPIELVKLLKESVDEMEERDIVTAAIADTILRARQCLVTIIQLRFVLIRNMGGE